MAIKNNVKPDTVLKTFWKNNQRFADLAYDSRFSYYLKEYNEITAKNRNEKNFDTSDEFLSGLQKSDRLHPVISLCIYYGKEDMRMSLPGKLNFEGLTQKSIRKNYYFYTLK